MATNLESRVKRLEGARGGWECPRCSGTTVVYLNGGLDSVSKHGRRFPPEEAEDFVVAEEENGRCPVCGAERGPTIRIGWESPRRA